jgi:hypothetical protein
MTEVRGQQSEFGSGYVEVGMSWHNAESIGYNNKNKGLITENGKQMPISFN